MDHSIDIKVHRTWLLLKLTYAIVPIIIGLDKVLFGWKLVDWAKYTNPLIAQWIPILTIAQIVLISGIIEVLAGIIVWFSPRWGGYLVATWLLLVIMNLLSMNMFYDIAARDFVLAIGAVALAWLTESKK